MEKDLTNLISKCTEKAKSGRVSKLEENGITKINCSYIKGYDDGNVIDITFVNPETALIVSYNHKMVLRAKNGVHDRYVPGDWETLI